MDIRNRIKELRHVTASELVANPSNWRTHPKAQQDAMRGVLAEVGVVDALIARELEDGSLELIDGHLRADTEPDTEWPVLVLDVTEEEAKKILATFDPLSAMAEADSAKLEDLVSELNFDNADLNRLMDDLEFAGDEIESGEEFITGTISEDEMELQPEEHYDYLVVLADNVNDWNRLVTLLGLPEVESSRTHRRIGMARAVHARSILEKLDGKY